jgi:hypothetical protein
MAPAAADAHGPVDPAATSYLATVRQAPRGIQARVVDGDQRMWLRVSPRVTATVLDYRGVPYLHFSSAGVQVNTNSSMYYLNQVPPEVVPSSLGPHTRPRWEAASGGDAYNWHDGRLHALAATALAPGARFVGTWSVPLTVDGRSARITGGLTYAPNPSLVWFWPIAVAVLCALAGLRVRRERLDVRLARGLAVVSLVSLAVAAAGQQLHGRPFVTAGHYVELGLILAFVVWGAQRLVRRRDGWFGYFLIALAAIWEGATLIGVLTHGFVLMALPGPLARVAVVSCLAAGGAMLPTIFRLAERPQRLTAPRRGDGGPGGGIGVPVGSDPELDWEDDAAWELDV